MRRPVLVVLCASMLVLAGCAIAAPPQRSLPAGEDGEQPTPTTDRAPTVTPTETATPATPSDQNVPQDPPSDRLGWEAGYWANESLAITADDGLNKSERSAVIGRSMARVELIRGLEFTDTVPVEVVDRASNPLGLNEQQTDDQLQTFDNAKFEALFLVGESTESVETQQQTLNQTVQGAYSRERESIVLIAESDSPRLEDEITLAHELVHALQDQHFDSPPPAGTRDQYNGRNGLFEGDATVVHQTYADRCGEEWACLGGGGLGDSQSTTAPPHFGIYFLEYFPYESGPVLIESLRSSGGWSAVNAAYEDIPTSAREILDPSLYGTFEPRPTGPTPAVDGGWERVRPPNRPDYAVLGPSALAAGFGYTLYDSFNTSSVIEAEAFLNMDGITLNQSNPLQYELPAVRGWTGERLYVYERGAETGYVWRLAWNNSATAQRFAEQYRDLLAHWGGTKISEGTWHITEESPFADALSLTVDGSMVTIVNAPNTTALADFAPASR